MLESVDLKNNIEQDSTLLLFLFSKSPSGHAIPRQKHLELPAVSYLLIELFYILVFLWWGRTVCPTGARSRDYQHVSDGWITNFILLHEIFLRFDWLRAVVFQFNLKYLHVKITNLSCNINK